MLFSNHSGEYELPKVMKEHATFVYARVPSKYIFMQNTLHIWKLHIYWKSDRCGCISDRHVHGLHSVNSM